MLRSRARLAIKKKQKCFPFPGHLNNDSSFWFKLKEKKRIKANLYVNLQELKLQLFSYKNVSEIANIYNLNTKSKTQKL